MRAFTVHIKDDRQDTAVLVRDGFSWAAFLFTVLWAAWHRMWWWALALFVLFAVTGVVMAKLSLGAGLSFLIHGIFSVIIGLGAGEMRRWHLTRRGFRETGRVQGRDRTEAEIRALGDPGAVT